LKIAVSGGTGFIGRALCTHLASLGHTVYVLTRSNRTSSQPRIKYIKWRADDSTFPLSSINAFINLAGEPINSGRWTEKKKRQIVNSRVHTTQGILRQLSALSEYPKTFINASAVGYYGVSLTNTFTEDDTEAGDDFLASTVVRWEEEASKATALGMRTVLTRFGIVLGDGGALQKILMPYRFFAGGTVGSGKQWVSWIHIEDVAKMIAFVLENENIEGALNITAPNPVTMTEFGKAIAKALRRPHWIPAPSFALKLALGEMSILVLEGQKVLPEKAMHNGYIHSYPDLEEALTTILT
jgi:uncharacterized protein (TIGR01777 family)